MTRWRALNDCVSSFVDSMKGVEWLSEFFVWLDEGRWVIAWVLCVTRWRALSDWVSSLCDPMKGVEWLSEFFVWLDEGRWVIVWVLRVTRWRALSDCVSSLCDSMKGVEWLCEFFVWLDEVHGPIVVLPYHVSVTWQISNNRVKEIHLFHVIRVSSNNYMYKI